MHRRFFLGTAASALAPWAWASHGWAPYSGQPPLYLEGEVTMIIWADPHPHLELVQRVGATMPRDLRSRPVLPGKPGVDTAALVDRVVLPRPSDRTWRVELPALNRLAAWNMPRPKTGEVLGVIGFAGPPVTGTLTMQAEILYVGAKGYPLRSDPA